MQSLFRKGEEGRAIPELTPGAEWVLNEPSYAHRLHDVRARLELRKTFWFKRWFMDFDGAWEAVSRDFGPLKSAKEYPPFDSSLTKYEPGFWNLVFLAPEQEDGLLKENEQPQPWRLVSDSHAVQLSNIQALDLHLETDVEKVYDKLSEVFEYMEESVVLKSLDLTKRVYILRSDFGY